MLLLRCQDSFAETPPRACTESSRDHESPWGTSSLIPRPLDDADEDDQSTHTLSARIFALSQFEAPYAPMDSVFAFFQMILHNL